MNHTTKAALLLSMLLALNYPVGLHDLCLDSTAASFFKPSHESPGAADSLPLAFAFVVRKKGVFSGHFVVSRCFQNEVFLKKINNNEI